MDRRTFLASCAAGSAAVALTWPVPVKAESGKSLLESFRQPPPDARPHTWWHWMNGNVTADGITRDLEAMARVGVGGVQMFDVGCGIPAGPVTPLSAEWVRLVRHAASECGRLGMAFTVHNCPGWSSSGGPWITPELAMQQLVWSEASVEGGALVDRALPRPMTRLDYYRDAMVVAFPTPPGERPEALGRIARASVNGSAVDIRLITDADAATVIELAAEADSGALLIEFAEPRPLRSLTIRATPPATVPNFALAAAIRVEASEDGKSFRPLASVPVPNWRLHATPPITANFPPTSARFLRLTVPASLTVHELGFSGHARTEELGGKAGWGRRPNLGEDPGEADPAGSVGSRSVIDVSRFVDEAGRLRWRAPPGRWTVLRFGHTPTGARNVAAPDGGFGLECDKFSPAALDFHFNHYFGKILPALERLGERRLAGALIDSYETGMQNWTAGFPREFQARRGYAILPFMPALTGRIVDSPEATERFLWDLRRVHATLVEDHYFGRFDALCRKHGLVSYTEPYGNGPFDDLQAGSKVDSLMGEFWVRGGAAAYTVKVAATAAHVHGKSFVGAESFTGRPAQSRWLEHPYAMKALGDEMYTLGLNHFVFHRFAHQPHPTARPGMTMGPWGFHFDRTNTWFDDAGPWLGYAARCQHMLRQGNFVADILYFAGENSPVQAPVHIEEPVAATLSGVRPKLVEPVPEGYDYDVADADVLMKRASVRDGRIVLPDGMSYRVLVMPDDRRITRDLLERLRDLVREGMWLVGPRPEQSHGLAGYPASDEAVRRIAAEMWGDLEGKSRTRRAFGKGQIFWGVPLKAVLEAADLPPDVEISAATPDATIRWIHRRVGEADVYFIANGRRRAEDLVCTFRARGRPERWDALTGQASPLPVHEQTGDRVRVALRLEEAGSCFVVFPPSAPADGVTAIEGPDGFALTTRPFAAPVRKEAKPGSFTVAAWIKPETDLWPISPEIASDSDRPDIAAARATALARGGSVERLGASGASFLVDPPAGEHVFGPGNATLAISAGRNGVILYEHAGSRFPAVLTASQPIAGWTHLAVVYDKGKPTIFLDGERVASGAPSGVAVHAGTGMATPRPRHFEGDVAGFALHDRALFPEAIRRLSSAGLPPPPEPPAAELAASPRPALLAWRNGRYAVTSAAGEHILDVEGLPPPRAIDGRWRLIFPAGLGAPAQVDLDRLMSLRLHPDAGVRHFAGTVTYQSRFDFDRSRPGEERRIFLDLGRVEVIAAIRLNGRELGTLWKPPFRADITDALRHGGNALDVRVTTLWPNRLIGDEQFPAQYRYDVTAFSATGGIAALPDWYREGRPMPPGKRVAFATWRHFEADAPLLEAGLLGPVRLFSARLLPLAI